MTGPRELRGGWCAGLALAAVLVSGCSAAPASPDASESFRDAHPPVPDDTGESQDACPRLDVCHDVCGDGVCTIDPCCRTETCASCPDDCCPETGPADVGVHAGDRFDAWTSCDWIDGTNTCLCDGISACDAVAGGTWAPLGSSAMRACGRRGDTCDVAYFTETEGGAAAYRCTLALGACTVDVAHDCEQVLTCNLVMGDCPPEIMPTNVIPCALAFPQADAGMR